MTTATICRDPELPPGDTEVWSDGRFDEIQKNIVIHREVVHCLGRMARFHASEHSADRIDWDGTQEGWKSS